VLVASPRPVAPRKSEPPLLSGAVPYAGASRMVDKKSQGIIRDERGQEQPADNKRAQHVTSVEEKKKTEDEIQKDR